MIFAAAADVLVHVVRLLCLMDRKLTDGACQHGRYCVSDEKIRHRARA